MIKTNQEIRKEALLNRVNTFLGKNVEGWSFLDTIEELVKAGEQLQQDQKNFTHSVTVNYKKSTTNHPTW